MNRNCSIEVGEGVDGAWGAIIHIGDVGGLTFVGDFATEADATAAAQTFAREEGWTVTRVFNSDEG